MILLLSNNRILVSMWVDYFLDNFVVKYIVGNRSFYSLKQKIYLFFHRTNLLENCESKETYFLFYKNEFNLCPDCVRDFFLECNESCETKVEN